jgi:MFS family permease
MSGHSLIARVRPPVAAAVPLGAATLIQSAGLGLLVTLSVLYFTRFVGLTVAQVGIGLTITGCLGLVVGVPVGHLADRTGPRRLLVVLTLAEAGTIGAYAFVGSFAAFLVVVGAYQLTDRATSAVRAGLIATVAPPELRVRVRAYLRSVNNVGFAVGAVLASAALSANSADAYRAALVFAALAYVVSGLALLKVPRVAPVPRERRASGTAALRDRPYVALTALNALLTVHFSILEVALPLWVTGHTEAPVWTVTALFVTNTAMVTVLQVPVSRYAATAARAGRAVALAGAMLAAACLVFGVSGWGSAVAATVLLFTGAAVYTAGELLHSAASWTLGFALAPDHAQGQYQGLFSSGGAAGMLLGPAIVTLLAVDGGFGGWLILGMALFAVGLVVPLTTRWAARAHGDIPEAAAPVLAK